eukprot:m.5795 g.5795  ORF g.5795 m.5795 type:complete len:56 (+) comp14136_c0_seq1:15-182(+)
MLLVKQLSREVTNSPSSAPQAKFVMYLNTKRSVICSSPLTSHFLEKKTFDELLVN